MMIISSVSFRHCCIHDFLFCVTAGSWSRGYVVKALLRYVFSEPKKFEKIVFNSKLNIWDNNASLCLIGPELIWITFWPKFGQFRPGVSVYTKSNGMRSPLDTHVLPYVVVAYVYSVYRLILTVKLLLRLWRQNLRTMVFKINAAVLEYLCIIYVKFTRALPALCNSECA